MKSKNIIQGIDSVFLVSSGILLLVGLVILQSASGPISYRIYDNPYHELINQIQKGVLPGIVSFFLFANIINYNWLRRLSKLGWLLILGLNILVISPVIGVEVNGANRWLNIGGFQIQPAEFLKLALILYFAAALFRLGEKINSGKGLLGVSFIIGISSLVVVFLQSSLSNGIILLGISISMLFQSKIKFRFVAILFLIGIVFAVGAVSTKGYRRERVMTLLQPEQASSLDDKYQINNNLIAVGSGGILGVGLGESRQKFFYLPEASTDSIFAVFAEEAGFVGVLGLVALFLTIIFRMLWLHSRVNDVFAKYIIIGGVTWFSLQTIINIAPTIQLLPVTGVPLPFVSSGGTSIIVFCTLFGIIANISKHRL